MSGKSAGVTGLASSATQGAAFEALLGGQPEQVADLARQARALVLDVMPGVTETIWPDQGTASYGIGPRKMSEHFVYFTFAKKHLGFGFYYGADLADPAGLLEGSGKAMRRARIGSAADLQSDALRALVEAASQHLPKLK